MTSNTLQLPIPSGITSSKLPKLIMKSALVLQVASAVLGFSDESNQIFNQPNIQIEEESLVDANRLSCPRFRCSSSHNGGINMDEQVYCFKSEIEDPNLVNIKQCAGNQMCHKDLNRCMLDPYVQITGRENGSLCNHNYECLSNYCLHSKCYNQATEDLCVSHSDCNVGMFCGVPDRIMPEHDPFYMFSSFKQATKNPLTKFPYNHPSNKKDTNTDQTKICQPQLGLNDFCESTSECVNSLTCANNKCVPYGTLKVGEVSDNELACESGFIGYAMIEDQVEGNERQEWICMNTPILIDKEPPYYQCPGGVEDTCTYQTTFRGKIYEQTLQCQCGLNNAGAAFCPKFYTSEYTTLLRELSQQVLEQTPLKHPCHTLARHDIYECLILNIETKPQLDMLEQWIIMNFERQKPNLIALNPPCLKQHSLVSQYWAAREGQTLNPLLHEMLTVKAAQIMQKPSFIVLLCFLILICYVTYRN